MIININHISLLARLVAYNGIIDRSPREYLLKGIEKQMCIKFMYVCTLIYINVFEVIRGKWGTYNFLPILRVYLKRIGLAQIL